MEKDYWGNLRVLEIDKSREKIKEHQGVRVLEIRRGKWTIEN